MADPVYRRPDRRVIIAARKDHRESTFARAQGICNGCGYDLGKLVDLLRLARELFPGPVVETIRDELALDGWTPDAPLWAADHIIPLSEGGPDTLPNMQLLCQRCHNTKGREEAQRRAYRKPKVSDKARQGLCDGSHRRPAVISKVPRVVGCKVCLKPVGLHRGNVRRHVREDA